MKKGRYGKKWTKIAAYLAAVSIIFGQPMVGMATEDQSQPSEENTVEFEENDEISDEVVEEEITTQIEDLETAQEDLQGITEQKSILALVYLCDQYEVKDTPSKEGSTVVSVMSGQSVQIEGVDLDEEGNVWYMVSLYQNEQPYTGYIEENYLATSDEVFLEWTDEYVEEAAEESLADRPMTMSLPIMTLSDYPDIDQFPASYQNALLSLKQKYPNWVFVKMETGLDFDVAVSNELGNKSWISSTKPASWQNGAAVQSGWSYASEGILRYYMDPRNFLTESAIFQFEQLTYNASYHTETAVQAIVENSFMAGDVPDENMTYATAFTKIGEGLKISPFHLASRVLQEQGTKGSSPLISGTYSGFEGYYNYFNVGANGKDIELIINGLTEAKSRGWNSRYKSLKGGAEVIGKNYILRGQDTLYLQKFNVSSNNTYNHQYMQNIMAPASEAPNIKKAYANTGSINNSFVFKIPVYRNMPASACPQPDTTDKITLSKSTISDLAVGKTTKLVPYVNGAKPDYVNDMTFSTNNANVATVDAQGVVKAVTPGTATITCARSGAASATCTVTVVKAVPVVETPILAPVVYKVDLRLADISLPSDWSWSDESILLEAGTTSYPAIYTPEDTTRYLTVTKQIGLKVSQAIPDCTIPVNLTAKLGSSLGSIALPDGFIWESDAETILDKAGEQTFYLSYYPSDKNYFELLHIPVVVKIIDDKKESEEPDDQGGLLPGGDVGSGSSGSNSGSGGNNSNTGSDSTGKDNNGNSGIGSGNTDSGDTTGNGSSMGDSGNKDSGDNSDTGSSGSVDSDSKNSGRDTGGADSTDSNDTTSGGSTSNDNSNSQSSNNTAGGGNISSGSAGSDSTNSGSTTNSGNTSSNNSSQNSGSTTNSSNTSNNGGSNQNSGNTTSSGNGSNSSPVQSNSQSVNNSASVNNNNVKNNNVNGNNNANWDSTLPTSEELVTEEHEAEPATEEREEEPVYERPSVAMNMEELSVLTEEMLWMAKEQNIDLALTMNDRAKWYVDASTAAGGFSDIDMNVLFKNGVIPQELLENAVGDNEYLEFSLAHDGAFGFSAELEIALNPEDYGRYANLFYFDPEAQTLDFICAGIIDENGYARFSMEHASSYVIIISDYPMTGIMMDGSEMPNSQPWWLILGAVALMSLAAIGVAGYFYWRKRQYVEEDCEEEYDEDDVSEYDEENEDIFEEEDNITSINEEDDWIEDEDWQKSEKPREVNLYVDDHAEDDWIEDEEWDISNDWMDDEEWEKRQSIKKTAV